MIQHHTIGGLRPQHHILQHLHASEADANHRMDLAGDTNLLKPQLVAPSLQVVSEDTITRGADLNGEGRTRSFGVSDGKSGPYGSPVAGLMDSGDVVPHEAPNIAGQSTRNDL